MVNAKGMYMQWRIATGENEYGSRGLKLSKPIKKYNNPRLLGIFPPSFHSLT